MVMQHEVKINEFKKKMVCNALIAGGRLLGAEQRAMRPG